MRRAVADSDRERPRKDFDYDDFEGPDAVAVCLAPAAHAKPAKK